MRWAKMGSAEHMLVGVAEKSDSMEMAMGDERLVDALESRTSALNEVRRDVARRGHRALAGGTR